MAKSVTNTDIDIGLAALCLYAPKGHRMSLDDIADVCNCSRAYVFQIQKQALTKAKARALQLGFDSLIEN